MVLTFRGAPPETARAASEDLKALGAEARPEENAVVATFPPGNEVRAINAARAAAKSAEDFPGAEGRAGVHAGGPEPEIAARTLAGTVPAGGVAVSKAVERLVPRRYRFKELPVVQSGAEAVPPYEVVEELGAPGEFGAPAEIGPFLDRMSAAGTLQQVQASLLIVGPPGSGRARLARSCRDLRRPTGAWVATGRCGERPPSPGGAFGEMLRAEAAASGFDRFDGERVVASLKRLGATPEDADTLALSLGLRLNAETDPPAPEPARVLAAWTRLVAGLKPKPLLCLENLDRATDEEKAILEALPANACTVIATAEAPVKSKRTFLPIPIRDLNPDAIAKLAQRVGLPAAAQPPGHPLLLEQLGALASEAGEPAALHAAAAPDPLRAAIVARLAAMPADAREALCAAALLGRSFWRFNLELLLARDVGDALLHARRSGWLLEREGSLMRADGELIFRHDILRESAESLLAADDKKRLHQAAAQLYVQRAVAGPATAARASWHVAQSAL